MALNSWKPVEARARGGYHRIIATPPGKAPRDITFIRGTPVQLNSYATADPFGDSVASLTLPMVTPLDDPTSEELCFLQDDTLLDIWFIPAMAVPDGWVAGSQDTMLWTNPITNKTDIVCPAWVYELDGGVWTRTNTRRGDKVWEGHIASEDINGDDRSFSTGLSLQGALFQIDATLAKPFYPARPQTVESLIIGSFSRKQNPGLRTQPARIEWPGGWTRVAPSFAHTDNVFKPNVSPGARWTGYTTRQTGSWDHRLTSFVQNLLAVMLVKPGSGIPAGNQWTLLNIPEGDATYPAGRTPVLRVRDRKRDPDVVLWAGQQGVTVGISRDLTQAANVLYGTGTDLAGTTWRNAVIAKDGSRTDYKPLAWNKRFWPPTGNKAIERRRSLRETYVQYGNGFSQTDASQSGALTIERDQDPGYSGTVRLSTDPSAELSRWKLRAGMTLLLKGFRGSGETGVRFHIAQTEASPNDGSVTLTVDTRYRDLITLQEALARTRDALTPAKLLQLNRNSVTIEDIQAPWDYSLGSGFIPITSRMMYAHKPENEPFPYTDWAREHPPHQYPHWYIPCHANASNSQRRWSGPWMILMAEKGTIRRTEIFCVDRNGNLVKDKFHFSLWYSNGINAAAMPNNGRVWSPFIKGAFESIDPSTGQVWSRPGTFAPNQGAGLVIGWGNYAQPAGYSPGLFTAHARPSGLLVDESSWTWDCSTNNNNYDPLAKAGREKKNVISLYAMFYSQHRTPVYFGGRLYREEPGSAL